MKKFTFEQIGGTYRQEGNYFLPNLAVTESTPMGIWGQRRRQQESSLQHLAAQREAG